MAYERLVAERFKIKRAGGLMPADKFLPISEYARSLSETKILINTQTAPEREQLKGRVGQAFSSGTLLLEQWSLESEAFLKSLGVEELLWKTHEELVVKINYWLSHEDMREIMAANARQVYQSKYNPYSYTRTILQKLNLG